MLNNQLLTSVNAYKYLTEEQRIKLNNDLKDEKLSLTDQKKIQIILLADSGKSQTEISKLLNCSHATANRYIQLAREGNAEKWRESQRGRPKKVNEKILKKLKELVTKSPRDFGYPFQRWTGDWLAQHLYKEFEIKLTKEHVNRLIKKVRPIQIKDLPQKQKIKTVS